MGEGETKDRKDTKEYLKNRRHEGRFGSARRGWGRNDEWNEIIIEAISQGQGPESVVPSHSTKGIPHQPHSGDS